ncbi:FBD-associated F-box protein [Trifolium repens]|nr:FBD-associated F-box protein [Trifolium repens]
MMDIISTLPDGVLCHILSFLKTKQAVATSILSKRWKHLWLSVPVLDFSNTHVADQEANFRFNDFVYSVLLSRDSTIPIKVFHLYVMYNYSQPDNHLRTPSFAKWINFVLQRGVEYLDLQLGMGWPILPINIFSCTTLVVLKLRFFLLDPRFSSVLLLLPSLKTLDLQFIMFPNHEDFMLLLDQCPNLEDLRISDLGFDDEEDSQSFDDEEDSQSFDNDEDFRSCDKWKNFTLSNLTKADVDSSYFDFPMKALHTVQSLSMCIYTAQVQRYAIPTFHNLTHLHLDCLNYRWNFLVEVLKHCPKLQLLYLDEAGLNSVDQTWTKKDDKENWVDPDIVPQCLSLHLRACYLSSFLGLQGELRLARYILKNAKVLQTMRIDTIGQQPGLEELLSSFPRASSLCKFTFVHLPCDDSSESDSSGSNA